MQRINHLLINRPRPRQRTRPRRILHHLVQRDPDARVHEAGKRPNHAVIREDPPRRAGNHAHAVVVHVVQKVRVALVELGRHAQVVPDGARGNVRRGAVRDQLLEPVCADHGDGADEAGSEAEGDGGAESDSGEGGVGRFGVGIGWMES